MREHGGLWNQLAFGIAVASIVATAACAGDAGEKAADCGASCGSMVTVPAGAFWQGCTTTPDDDDCYDVEKPYHQVTVPTFEIDTYEVTVESYGEFLKALGDSTDTYCNWGTCMPLESSLSSSTYCTWRVVGKEKHPINCITWYQARAYCEWAGKRLCTESEWEKASRGTDGRRYPWGNEEATCDHAVMSAKGYGCGRDSTWAVGSKSADTSPYGAVDMSGGVAEWVEDDGHRNYAGAPTNGGAWVDEPRDNTRILRGGSFGSGGHYMLSSYRDFADPADDGYGYVGFRCCR